MASHSVFGQKVNYYHFGAHHIWSVMVARWLQLILAIVYLNSLFIIIFHLWFHQFVCVLFNLCVGSNNTHILCQCEWSWERFSHSSLAQWVPLLFVPPQNYGRIFWYEFVCVCVSWWHFWCSVEHSRVALTIIFRGVFYVKMAHRQYHESTHCDHYGFPLYLIQFGISVGLHH